MAPGPSFSAANAGMIVLKPSSRVGIEEFDAQFATNTRGVFFGVQKVAPLLRSGGSIILTSSIASDKVLDGHAVYAGSKAAIEAFARSWALEFKERGIRVNVLSPGANRHADPRQAGHHRRGKTLVRGETG